MQPIHRHLLSGEFELVTLRNGHRAVRHTELGEVMHPSVGPWAEANALYVNQAQLAERLRQPLAEPVRIFDVGLGAAANAIAAATCFRSCGARRRLEIHSFELSLEPLRLALADEDGFPFLVPFQAAVRKLLACGAYQEEGFSWTLHLGDVQKTLKSAPAPATLVFHDPFSPESNTPLWTPKMFAAIRDQGTSLGEGTLLLTYSASTRTRTSMLLGGLFVGVGDPIGQKRETTVAATRLDLLRQPLDGAWLSRWTRSSARAPWGAEALDEASAQQIHFHSQFQTMRST